MAGLISTMRVVVPVVAVAVMLVSARVYGALVSPLVCTVNAPKLASESGTAISTVPLAR